MVSLLKIPRVQEYLILLCLLTVSITNAQVIKGKITDENNKPLQDVGIFNKTSGQHTHSNGTGYFVLERTSTLDTVYFSRLGYATEIIQITKENLKGLLNLKLKESSVSLEQVIVVSEVDALSHIVDVDVKTNPVKSSQEILRKVPGLIIGQHAGGGKAEQIFLRGFDVDHGTDVALQVDGLPVNMVSHAHGQGYADLHFVIPETIENVNFGKGPYYADQGNFNTAGYVDLRLRKSLDESMASLEVGDFNTQRLVGMFNVLDQSNNNAYLASELYLTDGPVESPQNFNRINIMGRYRYYLPGSQELLLTASHFQSKWDASGQIPQRAVDQGLISRFGAIDDTEGGETGRTNFLVNHSITLNENQTVKSKAYVSKYDFELYSNFTFFLEDSENGDQISQREQRTIIGAESVFENKHMDLFDTNFEYSAGLGFRYDNVDDNELSSTLNRQTTLNQISFGNVDEVNMYGFLDSELQAGNFTFNPSIRLDYFKFDYINRLSALYDNQSESKLAISPKFNTIYSPNFNTQFFLKTGIGFHSNDARVVVANDGKDILPAAYGVDLGAIFKPMDKFVLNTTLWGLWLNQEFVYVGDAGVVEPSGKTRRLGVELGARYQATDWLYLYSDANYTWGRSIEEPKGENFIPLAPDFTAVGGFTVKTNNGFSGGLNYRYIDDRPANEDNSIVAEGYFVTDANISYTHKNVTFGLTVENLFDVEWNETQFATESRLFNESESVEEIHFTPGTPFFLRGKIAFTF
ncbi:TonB-dependent receptor [Croceitalea sp. MTPC9]|uniref:TonB-dependent receptor n=1 Tax=unclassified Croceitalea TaxID=2632280 RepID=UPI002B376E9C|nr:TonB-dependent receptor [Croceitalea sp. MTPC6]GMN17653.1 TonB-dependent receptor [Croceitalea sp. MTPC9]